MDKNIPRYAVGRGRPPLASRFTPGRSGNPAGRAKGSTDLAAILKRTLAARDARASKGRRRAVTKLEAMVERLVAKAVAGDLAAMRFLAGLTQLAPDLEPAAPLGDADRAVMRELWSRVKAMDAGGGDEEA